MEETGFQTILYFWDLLDADLVPGCNLQTPLQDTGFGVVQEAWAPLLSLPVLSLLHADVFLHSE